MACSAASRPGETRAPPLGCTREAVDFTRLRDAFAATGTAVLGVSADTVKAQEAFRNKHQLGVPLISDEKHEMLATKTPRRNVAIQEAEDFVTRLRQWCGSIRLIFIGDTLRKIEQTNNPAKPTPATSTASVQQLLEVKSQYSLFNPILPLMEEREPNDDDADNCNRNTGEENMNMLLAATDTSKLLNEQVQTLTRACGDIKSTWPEASEHMLLTSAEATLSLMCRDLIDLSDQYTDTLNYIESMMEMQLIAAIGKRLTSKDLDAFVKYHNARLLSPSPLPFSHAVRRPEHYPGKPSFCNSSHVPIHELTVAW